MNLSHNAQLGIFVSSVAIYKAIQEFNYIDGVDYLLGHSLGEWTALHIAGVVGFEDTLRILKAGVNTCKKHVMIPGLMLAVMNLDGDKLLEIADITGCFVANFNSLSQTVLSGEKDTIYKAEELAKEAGAKRTVILPVAGAFHSPLMKSAAEKMEILLSSINIKEPHTPVVSNVTGEVHNFENLKNNMVKQITSSVRWVSSIEYVRGMGVENYIECGPGRVLSGLIKRIDKNLAVRNIGVLSDLI